MIINCTLEELKNYLEQRMNPKRYAHSLMVADCARDMALKFEIDADKAYIAGLLHDCGRTMSDEQLAEFAVAENVEFGAIEMRQPVLLHAGCGAVIAGKYFGVGDAELLASIAHHTTGAPGMTVLEKIIYLADMIEPERKFDGVKKLRKLAGSSLDEALLLAYDISIKFVLKSARLLHPKTMAARNELLLSRGGADDRKKGCAKKQAVAK